ncbi:Astacin-like metalloendopeptidase [Strongyloides ratti]|uniref:Astacin-like metalloendopeptidase n=1 Tax=Strongyloides ratti TaxID=34506 RepID=A0A090LIV6_STRRB|nr:Astacin-like metalloendopeptidase [Strongyloides ratti]CEF69722.1 Astacin-like metalloendopeptidase [Strongyloides ratti]
MISNETCINFTRCLTIIKNGQGINFGFNKYCGSNVGPEQSFQPQFIFLSIDYYTKIVHIQYELAHSLA